MGDNDSGNKNNQKFSVQFTAFAAVLCVFSGLILLPPVFEALFSYGDILQAERSSLLKASCILFLIGAVLYILRRKTGLVIGMLFFICFLIFGIELLFRTGTLLLASDKFLEDMETWGNYTHQDESAYIGHPFLHFSGRSNASLKGSEALRGFTPFNNFGFVGSDFYHYKKPQTIRIACLGESTTADGYPWHLEQYLNNKFKGSEYYFEVLNFGHAHWTTAHSLVNYFMNIVDFNPDIIVIHHAWNEEKIRGFDEEIFRNDYSHIFKSFQSPFVYDRYLIRYSAIYRYFKFKYDQAPRWASLAGSIEEDVKKLDWSFNNLDELDPFIRNLNVIIDHAGIEKTKVFFATIPRTTDSTKNLFYGWKSIDQCNQMVREICASRPYDSYLIDVDKIVTGKRNDIFTDLAHVNNDGRDLKAQIIGDSILSFVNSAGILKANGFERINQKKSGVSYYRNIIRSDSAWFNDITRKASEKQISIDSMLMLDAIHMVNEDLRWFESKTNNVN